MKSIKVIGFDADDTLWENGSFFKEAETSFCSLLSEYMEKDDITKELFRIEMKNMEWYGYGAMAFTLSMVEASVHVSNGKISSTEIGAIIEIGRKILNHPVLLFPGVLEVLPLLQKHFRLIVITKGDLLDQERKLKKSGLLPYFHHIEVVSEKHKANYLKLVNILEIKPEEFLMVGNSIKSDIAPVLSIGGKAVHIPHKDVWQHENSVKPAAFYFEISSMLELPGLLL
jgi:putative hydrolase of the HAD superfamily